MIIEFDPSGSAEGLEQAIHEMAEHQSVRSMMVLAGDANGFTPERIDPILHRATRPVFGGIFPAIIHGPRKLERGTIVVGLPVDTHVETITGLSDSSADFEAQLDQRLAAEPHRDTMFVFVDGLARRIGALLESLFDVFGLEPNYLGGGAGSLSFVPKPCLFTNAGLVYDCAVLALSSVPSGVGVNHGWTEISGPHQVTSAEGPTIFTLDSSPAYEVYRSVVEARSGRRLSDTGFFELAKGFPFGISKLGVETIVRDPIAVGDDGSLRCVGDVPQGSFIHILNGNADALVTAAGRALDLARADLPRDRPEALTLFIDCISRVLVLGDDFDRELRMVYRPGVPLVGALTLGEIANSGKDYLEFYNKTSVVGVLG